jgi:hypothetical protein
VRQTLALEGRLAREAQRQDQEERAEQEHRDRARVEVRKGSLWRAMDRLVWAEYEGEEAEELMEEVDARLGDEMRAEGFADEALDAQVARLCEDLGLPLAEGMIGRRAAAPPQDPETPLPASPTPYALGDWADPADRPRGPLNGAGQGPP